jgi:hypothetical protein
MGISRFIGIIFSIFWILLVMALFSDAGIIVFAHFLVIVFGFVWVAIWSARLYKYFINSQQSHRKIFSELIYWGYEPLILLIFLALAYSGTLMKVRFHVSYAALNQYANDVNAGKIDMNFDFYHPVRQIGLYSTSMTDQLPNKAVRFVTSGDGLFTNAGFAYFPETTPPVKDKNSYAHIDGFWWLWKQRL